MPSVQNILLVLLKGEEKPVTLNYIIDKTELKRETLRGRLSELVKKELVIRTIKNGVSYYELWNVKPDE